MGTLRLGKLFVEMFAGHSAFPEAHAFYIRKMRWRTVHMRPEKDTHRGFQRVLL